MPHRDPRKKKSSSAGRRRKESFGSPGRVCSHFVKPENSQSVSLLEKVRSLFSWIARRVTEEARAHESPSVVESSTKQFVGQYSSRDLLRRAEATIAKLELAKQALLQKFGPGAQAFIDRYVTPVVEPIQSIVRAGRQGNLSETVKSAVGTVELSAILHDETRLRRKIKDFLEVKTRDVILEDIAFILSYHSEAVEGARIPVAQRREVLRKLEEGLQPVLMGLEELLSLRAPSIEFISLFQWRVEVDSRRQRLHDAALQAIDEVIRRYAPAWGVLKDRSASGVPDFLEDLETLFQGEMTWPASLFELEEISSCIRKIVEDEGANRTDARVVAIFQQMRAYVETFRESVEGEGDEEVLSRIIDHVRAIEHLIEPPRLST